MAEDPKTSPNAPDDVPRGDVGDIVVVEEDGSETVLPPGPDVTGAI
jgi:hypothetical protein